MDGKNGELGGLKAEMESQPSKLPINDVSLTAENLPVKEEMGGWRVEVPVPSNPDVNLSSFQTKGAATGQLGGKTGSWTTAPERNVAPGNSNVPPNEPSPLKEPVNSESPKSPEQKEPQKKEVVRKLENGFDKKETSEYKEARVEWLKAKERSNTLQTEYKQKYETYLQNQTKENSFKKGWRATRKWLGLKPQLSEDLVKLSNAAEIARRDYFESSNKIRQIRLGDIDTVTTAVREGQPVSEGSRETTVGQIDDTRKLMDRYGNMLAYKLVIGARREQQEIQERVAGSVPESDASKRIKSTMEALRKYRYVRWGTMALGYGVLAGATGGLGAAALAGGGYLARVTGGAVAGGFAGTMLRKDGEERVAQTEKELLTAESRAGRNLFERGFTDTEAEIERRTRAVDRAKGTARTKAAAAAVTVGVLGGGLAGEMVDSLEFDSSGKPRVVDTNSSPTKAGMTPPSGGGGEAAPPSNGSETVPKGSGVGLLEEHVGPDHEPNEDGIGEEGEYEEGENEGDIFSEPVVTHTVVRGDNAWNIMEGKGPDNNPVGGQSDVIKEMSLQDRRYWLDRVFDYCDKNPEFAKEVGAVKSGGNIHLIHPGETINVSMLDEKIVELMKQESTNNIPVPTPKPVLDSVPTPIEVPSDPQETPRVMGSAPDVPSPETIPEADSRTLSFIDELKRLGEQHEDRISEAKDPAALERAHQMQVEQKIKHFARQNNIELEKALDIINEARSAYIDQNLGDGDGKISLAEAENARKIFESNPAFRNLTELDKRYFPSRTESQMVSEPLLKVSETEIAPDVSESTSNETSIESPSVKQYVSGVEKSTGGWLFNGRTDVSGTFDAIKGLRLSQINEMVANDSLPDGIKQEGWDRWVAEVKDQLIAVPANGDEALGQYVARLANTRTA